MKVVFLSQNQGYFSPRTRFVRQRIQRHPPSQKPVHAQNPTPQRRSSNLHGLVSTPNDETL